MKQINKANKAQHFGMPDFATVLLTRVRGVKCMRIKRILILAILISASVVTHSKEIEITVSDCGPLARGELGVVFRADPQGKGQMYFVKGKASEVCPKVIQASLVRGTEFSYCVDFPDFARDLIKLNCNFNRGNYEQRQTIYRRV